MWEANGKKLQQVTDLGGRAACVNAVGYTGCMAVQAVRVCRLHRLCGFAGRTSRADLRGNRLRIDVAVATL